MVGFSKIREAAGNSVFLMLGRVRLAATVLLPFVKLEGMSAPRSRRSETEAESDDRSRVFGKIRQRTILTAKFLNGLKCRSVVCPACLTGIAEWGAGSELGDFF